MENTTNKITHKPLIMTFTALCLLFACTVAFLIISPTLNLNNIDAKKDKHISTVTSKVYANSNEFVSHIEDVTGIDIPHSYITTYKAHDIEYESFRIEFNKYHNTIDYFINLYFDNAPQEDLDTLEKMIMEDERFRTSLGDMKRILDINGGEVLDEYKLVYVMDTGEFNTLPDKIGEYRIITIFYDTDLHILQIEEYNNYFYNLKNSTQ